MFMLRMIRHDDGDDGHATTDALLAIGPLIMTFVVTLVATTTLGFCEQPSLSSPRSSLSSWSLPLL